MECIMSSFIDAVEQRLRSGQTFVGECWTAPLIRQALTEVMAEAGPVGEVQGMQWSLGGKPTLVCVRIGGPVPHGTLLFAAPVADDSHIKELEGLLAHANSRHSHWKNGAIDLQNELTKLRTHATRMEGAAVLLEKERDSLRAQLAAAQAALISARSMIGHPDNVAIIDRAIAAISSDQSAAGGEAA
jgi:hypothetical protein